MFDVVKFAKSLGFKVGESKKISFDENGFVYVDKKEKIFLIGVNFYRTSDEKKLITAFALAKYFEYCCRKSIRPFSRKCIIKF